MLLLTQKKKRSFFVCFFRSSAPPKWDDSPLFEKINPSCVGVLVHPSLPLSLCRTQTVYMTFFFLSLHYASITLVQLSLCDSLFYPQFALLSCFLCVYAYVSSTQVIHVPRCRIDTPPCAVGTGCPLSLAGKPEALQPA